MKRVFLIIGILALTLGGFGDVAFAQEGPPPDTVEVVPEADGGSGIGTALGANVLLYAIYIGAGALFLLLSNYIWKLAGKVGLQKSAALNGILRDIFDKGIDAAEGWGRRNIKSGSAKFDKAVEVIKGLLDAVNVPEKLRVNLEDRVEGHFAKRKSEGSI